MASNKERLDRALAKLRAVRVNSEAITNEVVGVAVTAGAAYAASYMSGKMGGAAGWKVKGIPIELLAGGVLYGLSMTGAAGKASHHLAQAGEGALIAYAAKMGEHAGLGAVHPSVLAPGATARGLDELEQEAELHSLNFGQSSG